MVLIPQFLVNKLIRDKLAHIDRWGGKRILKDEEYVYELKRKLQEEADEVMAAKDSHEVLEELADVQDVLEALLKALDLSVDDLRKAQAEKHEKRGGFDGRFFAERIILDEGHRLVEHCRNQPHKYTEISQ